MYPSIEIPVGPQHPALKEPERFLFKVDGERVIKVIPRIGYVHRGIEKAAEDRTYVQNIYLMERVCGICCVCHTLNLVMATEDLLGIEAPPRAQYLRVINAELGRIHSHLLWLGIAAHEVGFDTLFMYIWRDREVVMDLLEELTGSRVTFALNTIGGVRRDVTPELAARIRKGMDRIRERTEYYKSVCQREPTIIKRMLDVGILTTKDAVALCAAGPTLRASGVKRDVRSDDPYAAYDEIPFNVASHDGCDVLARVLVRCDEVIEAANMTQYAIDHLPQGPIRVRAPRVVPPDETFARNEAPRGEVVHYVKSNGTMKPERYKIRSPTLANIPSVCVILEGGYIADIPIALASIDPCFSCTDRVAIVDVNEGRRWVWTEEELRRYSRKWYRQK